MAGFTRTNGDFNPVAVYDAGTGNAYTNSGNINAATSAATVQPQGPDLAFFTITSDGANVGTNLNNVFSTIQQLATVYMYEYTDAANDTLAIAVYPVNAWTAATLQTAVAVANIAGTGATVAATATFTN